MGYALVAKLFPLFISCLLTTALPVLAQGGAADTDSSDAPSPIEVVSDPSPASAPDFRHRLLLNAVPGLSGEIRFLAPTADDAIVRALLTLDGKLLALPLKKERNSERSGSFPTPFKSLDYQFQISDATGSRLSPRYTANPRCAPSPTPAERFAGEDETIKNIQLLRNDSALLSATIDRITLILGKGK